MASPELVHYVRQQTHDGIAASDIRVALMEAGWSELDVDNALHDVAAGMQPVSAGASLHEDLAQVRGMVAHLASRVRVLEANLVGSSVSMPPPEEQLPGPEMRPERELTTHRESTAVRFIWVFAVLLASGFFGAYLAGIPAPEKGFWAVTAVVLAAVVISATRCMKKGRPWASSSLAALAVAIASLVTASAAFSWSLIGASVAAALGVLYLVYAVVMGRWIDRYSVR